MIQPYLDRLERELEFDRSLSRFVRQEVEDHLWEAVAADTTGNFVEAQARAVARFGDAREIAAQFAVVALAKLSRRAGFTAMVVIVGVFLAMKGRVAWYTAMQWAIGGDVRAVSSLVAMIDRYAFLSSLLIGLAGWLYIRSRQIPAVCYLAYRRQLRRFVLLCSAATAALAVSVGSDAVLTALQLYGTRWSALSLVPIASMAIEISCLAVLVFHLRVVTHRAAGSAALMKS